MLLGILGDTHDCPDDAIREAVLDLKNRGAEIIFHTGDIEKQHLCPNLFANLPVIVALTKEQQFNPNFLFSPPDWVYTRPGNSMITHQTIEDQHNQAIRNSIASRLAIGNRIVNLGDIAIYLGHERSYDVMMNAERFNEFIGLVNLVFDGVRYVFTGHTHHQFMVQRNGVTWINPGSLGWGVSKDYEYAFVDTKTEEVIFTRLPYTKSDFKPVTVGVLSDTGNISDRDPNFWESLRKEFKKRDVSTVIVDGGFLSRDIGRPEFSDFQVFYSLTADQSDAVYKPDNWNLVLPGNPIVDICSNRFLIQHGMGIDLDGKTEVDMIKLVREQSKKYQHVDFVVCGGIHNALFEEHDEVMIINPGDARNHRKFTTICFRPHCEITYSAVL